MNASPGDRFGRLTVIAGPTIEGRQRRYFHCRCDCGIQKSINRDNLVGGRTKSCGCIRSETSAAHCKSMTKHGESRGCSEYYSWRGMRRRCLNRTDKAFKYYGGRGIKICERWASSYEAFIQDMGRKPSPRHSIERKNNDGNYEPGNCVWALPIDQNNNRRGNHLLTVDGETLTVTQWARRVNLSDNIIFNRLRAGYSDIEAVKTPKRGSK